MRRMFSENQIKSIAQQFGGTKLYLHDVYDDEDTSECLILTSISTSLVGKYIPELFHDIRVIKIMEISGDTLVFSGSNADNVLYYILNGTIGNRAFEANITSDEITPIEEYEE